MWKFLIESDGGEQRRQSASHSVKVKANHGERIADSQSSHLFQNSILTTRSVMALGISRGNHDR
jgi:hypothetical protein